MEKIKNALKSVNKFGLLALVLIAFATLAFKAPEKNPTAQKYGWDQEQEEWVLIQGLTMDNTSTPATSTYRCDGSVAKCSGVFNSPPTSVDDIPDSDAVSGDFSLN